MKAFRKWWKAGSNKENKENCNSETGVCTLPEQPLGGGKRPLVPEPAPMAEPRGMSASGQVMTAVNLHSASLLVELYTSQGCSSCPPADELLSKLSRGELGTPPVVALSFHVDYWDYLGWPDPSASKVWTLRQRKYGERLSQKSIYTPELVVQGRAHCVGSSVREVKRLLQAAQPLPLPPLELAGTLDVQKKQLRVSLQSADTSGVKPSMAAFVAIYENNLVTKVPRGENGGRILTEDRVVHGLEMAFAFNNSQRQASGEVVFKLWKGFGVETAGLVVFVQDPDTMEVLGAQDFPLDTLSLAA